MSSTEVLRVDKYDSKIFMAFCTLAHAIFFSLFVLQENTEWNEWQTTALQERNMVENVYRWACGYASFDSKIVGNLTTLFV